MCTRLVKSEREGKPIRFARRTGVSIPAVPTIERDWNGLPGPCRCNHKSSTTNVCWSQSNNQSGFVYNWINVMSLSLLASLVSAQRVQQHSAIISFPAGWNSIPPFRFQPGACKPIIYITSTCQKPFTPSTIFVLLYSNT